MKDEQARGVHILCLLCLFLLAPVMWLLNRSHKYHKLPFKRGIYNTPACSNRGWGRKQEHSLLFSPLSPLHCSRLLFKTSFLMSNECQTGTWCCAFYNKIVLLWVKGVTRYCARFISYIYSRITHFVAHKSKRKVEGTMHGNHLLVFLN